MEVGWGGGVANNRGAFVDIRDLIRRGIQEKKGSYALKDM